MVSCRTSDAPYREALVIGRFLAGLKIDDLARAPGKQPGAVHVLQFRALRALVEHLGLVRGQRRAVINPEEYLDCLIERREDAEKQLPVSNDGFDTLPHHGM